MRFEIYHAGALERAVTLPTMLDPTDFDSVAGDRLITDWDNGRFYTFDLTGTQGIRAHRIEDNTQYLEKTYTELFGSDPTTYYGVAGTDGYLYLPILFGVHDYRVVRIDGETLDVVAQGTPYTSEFAAQWYRAEAIQALGAGRVENYIFTASFLAGIFQVISADTLALVYQLDTNDVDISVCGSHSTTSTLSDSLTYAYGVGRNTVDPDSVTIYRLTITIPPDLPLAPQATGFAIEALASLIGSTIDAARPRLISLDNLVFDLDDHTIIFQVVCATEALDSQRTYLIKAEPATGAILWSIPDLSIASSSSNVHTRVGGGRFAFVLTGELNHVINVNTRDGTYEDQNWAADVPGEIEDSAVSMFDYVSNCLFAFLIDEGPIRLCLGNIEPGDVSLAAIVTDMAERTSLSADDIDVSDLESIFVHGYAVGRIMPARAVIEAVRPVGAFDAVESDGILKFPARGGSIVSSLIESDLGAHEYGNAPPIAVTTRKIQDVELPRRVRVHYVSHTRDYEPAEQASGVRLTTDAVNDVDIEVAAAIDDDQAAQIADIIWADSWASRWIHEITLDVSHLALDPADPITLPVDSRNYRARIVSIDDSGGLLRRMELVREDAGNYVSYATADPPQRAPSALNVLSATSLLLLDLPALRDSDDDPGLYAAPYRTISTRTWRGAVLYKSSDGGTSWQQIAVATAEATVGTIVQAVESGISTTWDDENEIIVELPSIKSLESRTEDAVLNGANAAAIGVHGRWEIVQFVSAEQLSSTQWRLTGLLRGRRGTEHNIGSSVIGDRFALLSSDAIARIPLQLSEIGAARDYIAVSVGTLISSAESQELTGHGEALRPFSPVNVIATRDVDGNLTLTWVRRGRLGQELRSGADIPLSEATEAYEVDVASNDTIVRTITTTTQTASYSASQQISDFGSLPDGISLRVYQISQSVGRGTPAEIEVGAGSGDFPVEAPPAEPVPPITAPPDPQPTPSSSAIKFHPGIYVYVTPSVLSASASILSQINETASNPNLAGWQLGLTWAALETTEGDYSDGFDFIDDVLAICAANDKYLLLNFRVNDYGSPRTSSVTETSENWLIPQYVLSDSQYGNPSPPYGIATSPIGVRWSGGLKTAAITWNVDGEVSPVKQRLVALAQAYGARYNAHPNFEMLGGSETSLGVVGFDFTNQALFEGTTYFYTQVSSYWPNTMLRCLANYAGGGATGASRLVQLAETMRGLRNGVLGGPDPELPPLAPTRTITMNGLYRGEAPSTRDYRTIMPWIGEIQNFGLSVPYGGRTYPPSDFFSYYKNVMRASHVIYVRDSAWTSVLSFINTGPVPVTTCPPNFPSCDT
jgi:hypothetical protein